MYDPSEFYGEIITKTERQQQAKLQTYYALRDKDLPIPVDLRAEVEAIKVEQTLATRIVDAVLSNLHGRGGIGDELDAIEFNLYVELVNDLTRIVDDILTNEEGIRV